jgi:regulator of cell morphogenesis and NO signaling
MDAHHADWTDASIPELIEHIVAGHHRSLREQLTRAATLLRQATVFPATDQSLEFARRYVAFAHQMLGHLDHEERVLFPACIALDHAFHHHGAKAVDASEAAHVMALGHGSAAGELDELARLARSLPDGNKPVTVTALREAIAAMSADLIEHSRVEEEILLPAVLFEQEVVATRSAGVPLLP